MTRVESTCQRSSLHLLMLEELSEGIQLGIDHSRMVLLREQTEHSQRTLLLCSMNQAYQPHSGHIAFMLRFTF